MQNVVVRTNLVNGTNWGVKKFIFSVGRTRKGRQIHRDIKSDPVALTNNNQKQTWSVTLIDGLPRNCRQMGLRNRLRYTPGGPVCWKGSVGLC